MSDTRPLIVGIDGGTTAVKVALFDSHLNELYSSSRGIDTFHPQPGWVEQDPEEVLDAVISLVAEVLDQSDVPVGACGLDHQGESVVAWDSKTGEPLSPIIVWQDKRSVEQISKIKKNGGGEEITRKTGLPLDPYFSAGKFSWLLQHSGRVAEALGAGRLRMGTVDSFLCDRLGNRFATDPSTASRTQLCELGATQWDQWLLDQFGIPMNCLPAIDSSYGDLAMLSHETWSQDLHLSAQVCDQQAALAGAGCVTPGGIKATFGTGVFVLANVGDSPPANHGSLIPTVAWGRRGEITYALDGGVFSAGSLLEWLCRELGLAGSPEELGLMAREADGSSTVRILPALAGLGAPWWRNEASGAIVGLSGDSTRSHIARAAFEAIAWRVADIIEAMPPEFEIDVLRVDGGLTNETLMVQLVADATGKVIEVGGAEATVTGSAGLAAVGAGFLDGVDAIEPLIPTASRFTPSIDRDERRIGHAAWKEFVETCSLLQTRR